ncbi:hypothetical protein K440DRAFT_604758, partial [Wilcoxina mikolae CBS 423.85]
MEIVIKSTVKDVIYKVSSRQLRARSPVFRDLITSQAVAPAHPDQRHRVEVENSHNTTALAIVLYILHAQVDNLPENILFDNLVEIAVVCDYYRCATALAPWDEIWMKPWTHLPISEIPGYEHGLFIWWVFEEADCFSEATDLFAEKGFFDDDEFVVAVNDDHKSAKKLHHLIPRAIIDSIIQQRKQASQAIVKVCREVYERYESNEMVKCQCIRSPKKAQCDHLVFAELYMGFKEAGLLAKDWSDDIPSHISVDMAVRDLAKKFNDIRNIVSGSKFGYNDSSHSNCYDFSSQVFQLELVTTNPLELSSFGKNPVEKTVVTWEDVVSG